MAELAIVSARKTRLKQLADDGKGSARAALRLAEDPTQFLSTVQIGLTLGGVLAGAFGGSTLAMRLSPRVEPYLGTYAYPVSFGAVVTCITFLSVVMGELVPKRLALTHPETIAMATAGLLRMTTTVFKPFVRMLSFTTELVFRILHISPPVDAGVTDQEITDLMELGAEAGHFHEAEAEIVSMALRLGDRRVSSLMTPHTVMDFLDTEDPDDVNRTKIIESSHSRFPVLAGDIDQVLGVVQVKDLLAMLLERGKLDLRAVTHAVPFIPQSALALKALELFKTSGAAMALVVDEYGSISGLLTVNDILVALVGDIVDPQQDEDLGAVKRDDGSWLVDGILPIEELCHLLDMRALPLDSESNTVAGLVLTHLNRVAKVADHVEVSGFRFEVVDMDGRRIDKVLVVPPPTAMTDGDGERMESGGEGSGA